MPPTFFQPHSKVSWGFIFHQNFVLLKHRSSIKAKIFSRLKALSSIAFASCWSPSEHSLSLLYNAFIHPVLTYVAPGWYPFSSKTNQDGGKVLQNTACRVISGCLSYTPTFFLQLESRYSYTPILVKL